MIKLLSFSGILPASLAIFTLLSFPHLRAATLTLPAVADTSLHEIFPKNNFGAFTFVHGGLTGKRTRTRGLFRFDTSSIPAGARIQSVTLTFNVVYVAPSSQPRVLDFALHRMLTPWEEGTKDQGAGFGGRLATAGEATWDYSSNPLTWQEPGGAPGVDFAAAPSSVLTIGAVDAYTFPSTPELVADVQAWIDQPEQNFGWMLKAVSEDVTQSAKRFGSSESAAGPALLIEYTTEAPELAFTGIEVRDGQVILGWSGGVPPFQVQQRNSLDEPWANAGDPVTTAEVALPAAAPIAFFRVLSGE